ncbi:MAG: universal stress protein [bacterium]
MKKVLLILSSTRRSEKSISLALASAAAKKAELIILFILDSKFLEDVSDSMIEGGWLGSSASHQLHQAIAGEYSSLGGEQVNKIKAEAERQGVPCRTIVKKGEFLEETMKVIQAEEVDEIIVIRRKRSNLSRFFFGSVVKQLEMNIAQELIIVDEN